MVKPQIVEETPMSMAEAKEEIAKVKERDQTLSFRANKCEEYLNDFVSMGANEAAELRKKLLGLGITRLKEEHVVKIIDVLPKDADDVKVILGSATAISRKDMEQIAETVQQFIK